MLIVRAPTRISFGGGGTDLEAYYAEYGGLVVSAAINRYTYVVVVPEATGRAKLSDVECAAFSPKLASGRSNRTELALPRAALRHFGLQRGIRLYVASDVPSGTGLGSSSSAAVALTKALSNLLGMDMSPAEVAEVACDLEIGRLGMPIGRQDQYAAAFGGLNAITFEPEGVIVKPLRVSAADRQALVRNLMLFYTGSSRLSSTILRRQRQQTASASPVVLESLHAIKSMAIEMCEALEKGKLDRLGELLDLSWQLKKRLSPGISNPFIDECYWQARANGALGGKITGAGGGGFLLIYCPPSHQRKVAEALRTKGLVRMPFDFDHSGVEILLNNARVDPSALRLVRRASEEVDPAPSLLEMPAHSAVGTGCPPVELRVS